MVEKKSLRRLLSGISNIRVRSMLVKDEVEVNRYVDDFLVFVYFR